MTEIEAKKWAVGAGLAVGAFVYWRQSKPPSCAGISGQTLTAAIAGAETHPLEDFVEGMLGFADESVSVQSAGALTPQWAADFYAWYHGLSADQKAAVKQSASSGAEACAAIETAQQLGSGVASAISAVVAGALVYVLLPLVLK